MTDFHLQAIRVAAAGTKPFYINLWFHISHAPMFPTPAQYRALYGTFWPDFHLFGCFELAAHGMPG